ncbi:MAG: S1/P1 Nuclease [Candidatus Eremiobacteraeota bacterium]|nr:S1/P1 Nuclease [Candidatus Eremiobacteraeota bacterium]
MLTRNHCFAACLAAALALVPAEALAWGYSGHRIINLVAMRQLPSDVPSFLKDADAVAAVEDLGPEMDVLKGAGQSFDRDEDPGHYVDVGDDHRIAGMIALDALPADMEAYEKALESAGTDPYRIGYLPYTIADGWEQLRKDFAYWRVFSYLSTRADGDRDRAAFVADQHLREMLIVRDIGVWGHFVGDGSQPLHVTVHFNDGGIHAPFEGEFVRNHVTVAAVSHLVPAGGPRAPEELISQNGLLSDVGTYLAATNAQEPQLYSIARQHGFAKATPEAVAFATARVADGARELRDLIVLAWDNSLYASVGYPELRVSDILNDRVHPGPMAFGGD